MKKKHKTPRSGRSIGGFSPPSTSADFYSANPVERPLSDDSRGSNAHRVRKTGRHQAASGRGAEKMDPREKLALVAILKSAIMILLLAITFFMLWKGIGLYEESIWLEHADAPEKSPVLQEVAQVEDFDIQNQDSREKFAERIELWKEADRLVRAADALLQHNIYDQAIEQCQDALRRDPSHRGALERLGRLYHSSENYLEAANAYIRLLSVDPSDAKIQKQLIASLDALGDCKAVKYMAGWYHDQNMYDADVQRYLANALYAEESFEEAATAYDRVLRDSPMDILALEQQVAAYMQTQQYEKALVPLTKLREYDYRNPDYYKKISICSAQLRRGKETVQILGRAAQLFGEQMVLAWIPDPQLDPVREDRTFQAFTDRVGGEEFRQWIEGMAKQAEDGEGERVDIGAKLEMPTSEYLDNELLNPRKK